MTRLRITLFTLLLVSLSSCSALSNLDAFKGIASQVASAVTQLGATADKIGVGGGMLSQAKSAIESATGTLGGLQGKMAALAKPDQAIKDMLMQKLGAPIQSTTNSLNSAVQREPAIAESAGGAIDVLKKISGIFN